MSPTLLWAVLAFVVSSVALAVLARRDPKRIRASEHEEAAPLSPAQRRVLASVVLLPGAALIALDEWPALLIWFGSLAVIGWGLAQAFAPRS